MFPLAVFPIAVTAAILDTVLGHLAPHFLSSTNSDLPAARLAAHRLLAAYNVETDEELQLAAEIVSFSFHALEALAQAAAPGLPLNSILRLRGSAVSLSREAHKAQRKLDRLQRTRRTAPVLSDLQLSQSTTLAPSTTATTKLPATPILDQTETATVQHCVLSRQQRRAAARIAKGLRRTNTGQARQNALAAGMIATLQGAL